MLTPDRLERFARHIVLPEIGGAGQMALSAAHIVLIGCGGIGSPTLQYLAAAGISRFTLIDDDVVEASNLQRQTLFAEADIGRAKVEAATDWVRRFDATIRIITHTARLDTSNAEPLISGEDRTLGENRANITLVLDGSDNFATRLAVSDACVRLGLPLTSAAVGRFSGQIGNFAGHLSGEACYRCFVGDAFDAEGCDSCANDGVLGAFVGMVGTFAAISAIRIILAGAGVGAGVGLGDPQWGQIHLLDALSPSLRSLTITKDPACTCAFR